MSTRTALLFPGQGAQSVGMAVELCERSIVAREQFTVASEILGYDLLKLCTNGPAEDLDSTAYSQPAIYVSSYAALEQFRLDKPEVIDHCIATAGLSLGEYTALTFAGALNFEDGLRVVAERGAAMQDASEAAPSGMVSILGLDIPTIEQLIDEARGPDVLEVANLLCPANTVVSGSTAACERIASLADKQGAMRVVPLAVAGAFHTSLMQPAVERLRTKLEGVTIHPPSIPVLSNVDSQSHDDPEEIRELLIRQVVNPVRWEDSMRRLIEGLNAEVCYEVGPGRVLRGLLKRVNRKLTCESVPA